MRVAAASLTWLVCAAKIIASPVASPHGDDDHTSVEMGHTHESNHEMGTADSAPVNAHDGKTSDHPHSNNPTADSMGSMEMSGHSHGMPILENPNLTPEERKFWENYDTTTFFSSKGGNKVLLYCHSALTVLAFGFLYPISLMVSFQPRGNWLYLPLQTLVSFLSALAVILYGLYSTTAPADLYPGSVYGILGIITLVVVAVHWTAAASRALTDRMSPRPMDGAEYVLARLGRPSNDSGHEVSDETSTVEFEIDHEDEDGNSVIDDESQSFNLNTEVPTWVRQTSSSRYANKLAASKWGHVLAQGFGSLTDVIFHIVNVPLLFLGTIYLFAGGVTTLKMGQGHLIFGLLAHCIKGTVFFMLGFFELARYFGSLSRAGMGWNFIELDSEGRPLRKRSHPSVRSESRTDRFSWLKFWPRNASIEYWQSALIFFYGATNVFLEHLASKDGVWTHKDIQHVSIAFMFFGGGLCGMAIESQTLRKLIAAAFGYRYEAPTTMGPSFNPMPLFVIFWTGALMSKHHQETQLATDIHVQWGTLFSIAAMLRAVTYIMLILRPARDEQPQRPVTELLCSFCLICGGLIFVLSNRETVQAMLYRGVDSMFTLIVGVGVSALLMGYAIVGFAVTGLAA